MSFKCILEQRKALLRAFHFERKSALKETVERKKVIIVRTAYLPCVKSCKAVLLHHADPCRKQQTNGEKCHRALYS